MSLHVSPGRMPGRVTAGVRRVIARHPWIRWLPVSACCIGLVISVTAHTAGADALRAEWGESRSVWVTTSASAAGDPIDARLVELPAVAIPDEAADETDDVAGAFAVQHLVAGEIVTSADLAGRSELALLPTGWRAVAVSESPSSAAEVGETVDIASDGVVIAPGAIVVERVDTTTLVGVRAEVAPLVSLADASGIALLRTGQFGGLD